MKIIRKISKPAAIYLIFHMLVVSGLVQSAWAAMVSTESIIHINGGKKPRDYFDNLLARPEIQAVLISHGLDPQEAQARIDHLTDDEIGEFFVEVDRIPAGGGSSAGVVAMIIMFLIAVVADLFYVDSTPDN